MSDPSRKNETEVNEGEAAEQDAPKGTETSEADKIDDAEIVDEKPEETDVSESSAEGDIAEGDKPGTDADPDAEKADGEDTAQDAGTDDHKPETDTDTQDASALQPAPAPAPVIVQKRGGFFGPFLGGVVAAGLGFGLCYYLIDQGVLPMGGDEDPFAAERAQISALEGEISALQSEIASVATAAAEDPRVPALSDGLSALQSEIGALESQIGTLQAEITQQTELLGGLQSEMNAIAELPAGSGGADTAAVAALQARLQDQQAANEQMQARLSDMAAEAEAEMEAVRNQAGALQAETQAAVDAATNRAAIANVTAALESGAPLGPAIAALTVDVPDALSNVANTGVDTVLELQRAFPAAARDGLAASLRATVGPEPGERFMAFLRAQVGARSLEGREGNDPDAVLARAQEAVSEGRIADALAEISSLPADGQAAMSGWVSAAQARVDAEAARDALAAELTSN